MGYHKGDGSDAGSDLDTSIGKPTGERENEQLVSDAQNASSSSGNWNDTAPAIGSPHNFSEWNLSCCFCFKELKDRQAILIIFTAVLYFMSASVTAIPLQLLINKRIAGDPEDPSAESAFVVATNSFIHSIISFLGARYTSGFGDYVGRKPVLFLSSLTFLLSRVVYIEAVTPGEFYVGALLGGAFDCYYFSTLAWICDVFPEGTRRSKRVGLFTGVVGGFGFAIGVPLGAVLAQYQSIDFAFNVSIVMAGLNCICLLLLPVDDTIGARSITAPKRVLWGTRYIPVDMKGFLKENFPISTAALDLIKKARNPLDWLVNYMMHCTTGLLNLILIQYCLAVFNWSAVVSAAAVLSIGICLGLFAPVLLHRYSPIPLASYTMLVFTCGLVLMSVSGTGISEGPALGVLGIICFALGTSWVPSLQTNLLSQYGPDVQGVVSGVLSQQKEASLLPAYMMSLGFTVSLGNDGPVYWPGSAFAAAALVAMVSMYLHWRTYGSAATTLTQRKITDQLVPLPQEPLVQCETGVVSLP